MNLFIEDMPQLSADIDVVYTDHQATRDEALKSIAKGWKKWESDSQKPIWNLMYKPPRTATKSNFSSGGGAMR